MYVFLEYYLVRMYEHDTEVWVDPVPGLQRKETRTRVHHVILLVLLRARTSLCYGDSFCSYRDSFC